MANPMNEYEMISLTPQLIDSLGVVYSPSQMC